MIQMSFIRVRTPVWIASGMRHTHGMTKITDITDYY